MLNQQNVQAAVRRAGRLQFANRPALEQYQREKLQYFFRYSVPKASYYKPWLGKVGTLWPLLDAKSISQHFSSLCTAKISYREVFAQGFRLYARGGREIPRQEYYVLMQPFNKGKDWEISLLDETEQLKKIGHLFSHLQTEPADSSCLRIAHFVEFASILHRIGALQNLDYQLYDLFCSRRWLISRLIEQQPDIIIAPQGMLLYLAYEKLKNGLAVSPRKIYCENGFLTVRDRMILRKAFGAVHEMYTHGGGLLAISCGLGRLHLCEGQYFFEMNWLDDTRFQLIYTDFNTHTLPIVRYQTRDIILAEQQSCRCGSPMQTVKRLESRESDIFWLAARSGGYIPIFATALNDHGAACVPWDGEYRIVQTGLERIDCYAAKSTEGFQKREKYLRHTLENLGVNTDLLTFSYRLLPDNFTNPMGAVRRITRAGFPLPTSCYFH